MNACTYVCVCFRATAFVCLLERKCVIVCVCVCVGGWVGGWVLNNDVFLHGISVFVQVYVTMDTRYIHKNVNAFDILCVYACVSVCVCVCVCV